MAKAKEFIIKEDFSTLKLLRKQQTVFRIEKRIIWLIELQQKRFKTRVELAKYIGITPRTQERWSVKYQKGGIKELLFDKPKNITSKIITNQVHQGLSNRVNSSDNPFLGYWDAVDWIKTEYGVSVSYHLMRYHLIKHFQIKLKSPRKSHYKKR